MSGTLTCVICDCRDMDDPLLERICSLLSAGRRATVDDIGNRSDRVMGAVAGYISESLASSFDTHIVRLSNGKPVFGRDDIHLSISHSAGIVAVAWSDMPIGVDVQAVVSMSNIAGRMLTEKERTILTDMSDRSLVRIWTMKESYLKMTGIGIAKGLDGLDVLSEDTSVPGDGYRFLTRDIFDDMVLTVCGRSDVPLCVKYVDVRVLENGSFI